MSRYYLLSNAKFETIVKPGGLIKILVYISDMPCNAVAIYFLSFNNRIDGRGKCSFGSSSSFSGTCLLRCIGVLCVMNEFTKIGGHIICAV